MACVAALALAEVAARAGSLVLGVTFYAVTLIVVLNQGASRIGSARGLLLAIAVVAIERLVTLSMPLVPVGPLYQYLLVATATLAGIALVIRLARYSRDDLGLVLDRRVARISVLAVPPGLVLGFVYYGIARPLPLISKLSAADMLAPLVVLTLTTGLVEELLFRGLLQGAATRHLGPRLGTLYAATIYSMMAVVPLSAIGLAAVFATALGLAALTIKSGSIVPAAAAHASLNVALLLVAPFVGPGGSP